MGLVGPEPGRVSVTLHLSVRDVDASVERAAQAGATVERPPTDAPYGRTAVVRDPYGHRWMVQTPAPAADADRRPVRPGDPVYLTLRVPDGARARDFYEAVLGWSAAPGRVPDGWQVEGTTPMVGIGGGAAEPGTVPMYAVDDIEVAVAAVITAGGQAGEIESMPYGRTADCRDDQGLPFYLGQLS
jgi:predicted enzyme related to lactoylglutathione lyase